MPASASEDELVRRLKRGDGTAYHELVDRFGRRLFGLAYSLTGSAADAEDVVQETLVGAVKSIGAFERRASLWTWLTRIAVRQAGRHRRSPAGRRMLSLDAPMHGGRDGSADDSGATGGDSIGTRSAVTGVDARVDLAAAVQKLSEEHRAVIVLREVEQMSYEEMSAALRVPMGTVESRLFRARAELRKLLADYRVD